MIFFTVTIEKRRYSTWLLVLHLRLALAFTADVRILLNGGRRRLFSIRCTEVRDTPMICAANAGFCDFVVYRLVTDKVVQLQPNFRLSSQSRVFRCLSCDR